MLFDRPYPVLAMRTGPADAGGVFRREWLLQSREKFGPIRVEEQVRVNAARDRETVLKCEAFAAGEIMAKPREGVTREVFVAALTGAGAVSWEPIFGSAYWLVRFPSPGLDTEPQALAALARSAASVSAEGNGLGAGCLVPDDPRFPQQDSLQNTAQSGGRAGADIRMVPAWDICHASPDVIVAILDNGFDFSDPDLAANRYLNPREIAGNGIDDDGNGLVDDWSGWDFVDNDNDPDPTGDHGTTVMSILCARGDNGRAIAGVTWAVQLLPVKVTSGGGGGTGTAANLIAGINYARSKGARVMNMALVGFPYSTALFDAVEAARSAGILLVMGAGNAGIDLDAYPVYPASFASDNILVVANTDNLDQLNLTSSYGFQSVDLGAPGTNVPTIGRGGVILTGTGTSNAAPLVSGVAALLLQMRPDATVADLKHWILGTVDPLPSLSGRCVSGGRLNAYAALSAAQILPTITVQPLSRTVAAGGAVDFTVAASSPLPISYQWCRNGGTIAGATSATLTLSNLVAAQAGDYTVIVGNSTGSTSSQVARLTITAPLPAIQAPPASQHVAPGSTVTFSVTAGGTGSLTYQWKLNGTAIAGATSATYTVANVQVGNMGFYSVTVGNSSGSIDSDVAILTVAAGRSRLTALSTRGYIPAGGALTPGFYLRGSGTKSVIVRAVGPTLGSMGVDGPLSDPRMDLIPVGAATLLSNDNWGTNSDLPALRAAMPFALAEGSLDAAALTTLSTAINLGYTVRIGPSGAATAGITMAEVYDLDAVTSPVQFASLSTLGFTGTGENVLTPGFIITGDGPKQLLIRAVGPTLSGALYNVAGALADPQFRVVPLNMNLTVASNDNWGGTAALQAAFAQTYAFALPTDSLDAAAVVRLPPGGYTVQATGVGNTTGNVLVEVYDMDP